MTMSILTSTKKILGLAEDYTAFDLDVITHINAVFGTLYDLGIGPSEGFMIENASAEWTDFVTDPAVLGRVRTYVFLRVRLLFDPPATSFHINAIDEQIKELEWRLSTNRENTEWTPPVSTLTPVVVDEDPF